MSKKFTSLFLIAASLVLTHNSSEAEEGEVSPPAAARPGPNCPAQCVHIMRYTQVHGNTREARYGAVNGCYTCIRTICDPKEKALSSAEIQRFCNQNKNPD